MFGQRRSGLQRPKFHSSLPAEEQSHGSPWGSFDMLPLVVPYLGSARQTNQVHLVVLCNSKGAAACNTEAARFVAIPGAELGSVLDTDSMLLSMAPLERRAPRHSHKTERPRPLAAGRVLTKEYSRLRE